MSLNSAHHVPQANQYLTSPPGAHHGQPYNNNKQHKIQQVNLYSCAALFLAGYIVTVQTVRHTVRRICIDLHYGVIISCDE